MPHSSLAIANEFIRRGLADGNRPLTNMQVQKLVYLAHGWNLAASGEPLIEDRIEAWKFGPVIRKVYAALSRYGSGPVTRQIHWGEDTVFFPGDDGDVAYEELTREENGVIDLVWQTYGSFPAFKLSALTHQPNTPWSNTYLPDVNRPINDDVIAEHFRQLLAV